MTPFPSFMAQYGATLIANGYHILPIKPGEKSPGAFNGRDWYNMANWQRFCQTAPSDAEVETWSRWQGCGIGLACGNVIGIDIDVLDGNVAHELEALAREMLGDTPAIRIGKAPKRALYYRAEAPFAGRKMHPLEVYGVGSQMVLHGIHPDTRQPYDWPGGSLVEIDRDALPVVAEAQAMAWLNAAFRRLPDALKPHRLAAPDASPSASHVSADKEGTREAIASALACIPNDDLDGSSWILMCHAIKAALGEAGRELWLDWSKSSAKSGASGKSDTAERRWKTARPREVGAGTIYHWAGERGWVPPDGIALNPQKEAAMNHDPDNIAGLINDPLPPPDASPMPSSAPEREKFPAELLKVGGVIGDLARVCVDTAKSPQPVLALGAAITAVGALAGRKYRHQSNARTNVYAIGIAGSSGGKDHARVIIKQAFFDAGLKDYLGGGDLASGTGMITALEKHPCRIFLIDEAGKFVKSVTAKSVGTHREAIWTKLTELFTSAGSVFLGQEFADQKARPRVDIVQPCACIWGTTVPEPLWFALSSGAKTDGSLARFLIFQTDQNYPDRRKGLKVGPLPIGLIEGLQAVARGAGGASDLPELPDAEPAPYIVPQTTEADAMLDAITDEQTSWSRERDGTDESAIIGRYEENVTKIALIRAISDNPVNPVITVENVEWAVKLVKHCIGLLIRESERHVADNETEAAVKKLRNFIEKQQQKGPVSKNDITRGNQWAKARELDEYLKTLMTGGQVIETRCDSTGGRQTLTYRCVIYH